MRLVYYEMKTAFGIATVLAGLLLPGYALLERLAWSLGWVQIHTGTVVRSVELLWPLTASLMAAYPLVADHEVGFAELRWTYPEPRWRVPILRIAGVLSFSTMAALAGTLIYRTALGPYPVAAVVIPALAPTLYLSGVTFLLSQLTRSYWMATAAAVGYWSFEIMRRGKETSILFLFQQTWPLERVQTELNRLLLAGLGIVLLGVAVLQASRVRPGRPS